MSLRDLIPARLRGERRHASVPDVRAERRAEHRPSSCWSDGSPVLPGGGTSLSGRPVIIPWSER